MNRSLICSHILLAALLLALPASGDDAKDRARSAFSEAVSLFDAKQYEQSLAAFELSYSLAPLASTLYNIGLVHVAMGHPVEAVDAFEKFLVYGGVQAAQKAQVQAEIAAQRQRIGEVKVKVTPANAVVTLDGRPVSGSGPLRATTGIHRVEATLAGHYPVARVVEVVGREAIEVTLELQPQAVVVAPPVLIPPAPPPAPSPSAPTPAPAQAPSTSSQTIAGWSLAGVGVVGVGVGLLIVKSGMAKHRDALDQWSEGRYADARNTESEADNTKQAGGIVIGVATAMALGGGVLLLTDKPKPSKVGFLPFGSPTTGGVAWRGDW